MCDIASQSALVLAMSWREKIASASWLELTLWIGLVLLTLALLVLVGTRWGQVRPVSKCVVLSVFAHLLFLFYAYDTRFSFHNGRLLGDPFVRVSYLTSDDIQESGTTDDNQASAAADRVISEPAPMPDSAAEPEVEKSPPIEVRAPDFAQSAESLTKTESTPELLAAPEPPAPVTPADSLVEPSDQNAAATLSEPMVAPPTDSVASNPAPSVEVDPSPAASSTATAETNATDTSQANAAGGGADIPQPAVNEPTTNVAAQITTSVVRPIDGQPVPDAYQMRVASDRLRFAIPWGANENTEAAVVAALVWLAAQQAADGRWDASDFGAGRETRTLGQDRRGAGASADTGITGLALLAFLGSGHTHVQGQHRETVQHGLEYLMRSQLGDGSLVGEAKDFEKMYCHGIALIALSEAYALTGDDRLQAARQRGLQYTIAAQDSVSGGWRYRPGERGDLSQCGWQVMALRSAELGGFAIPADSRQRIGRFLDSVAQGTHGGLASYRPRERVTRTMTAEAMVCRLLLDLPAQEPAIREASEFLLRELPGQEEPNLYYWYYATLYLFQLQGDAWDQWNHALQRHLLTRQIRDGKLAGSWDTRDVWGGYGGRVYTTAMAALCLEVYYRYLPIYDPANSVRHADADPESGGVRR